MSTIGGRIKAARRALGLTLSQVQAQTDLSTGNLSDIENNRYLPSAKALIRLGRCYDVPIDWILYGGDEGLVARESPDGYGEGGEAEAHLLAYYRSLEEGDQKRLIRYAALLKEGFFLDKDD